MIGEKVTTNKKPENNKQIQSTTKHLITIIVNQQEKKNYKILFLVKSIDQLLFFSYFASDRF